MFQENKKRRNYIIYILFIFLSGSIFLADLFSNKKFSNIISDNIDFLVDGNLGNEKKPSIIKNMITNEIIRK